MKINRIRLCVMLLVSFGGVYSASAGNYEHGNYPMFSHSQLFSTGDTVSSRPNKISNAIESNQTVSLGYDNKFRSAKRYIFPEQYFGKSYYPDKLMTSQFVDSFQQVIAEFACAEYRFRNRMPEQTECDGYIGDQNKVEEMPFVSGQYSSARIEVNRDSKREQVSFYTYLKSSSERPLSSTFGAVHQLGTLFGRMASSKSLVLSLNLEAFTLDSDGIRLSPINNKPLTYFIVIPKSADIAKQKNQDTAARFVLQNAKLILLR